MSQSVVQIERTFQATPDRIFVAWTQPDLLKTWWCTPGYEFAQLEIDLRPGGAFYYELVPEAGKSGSVCTMEGCFDDVRPAELLSHTWTIRAAEFEEKDTQVCVRFTGAGGYTLVSLRHSGFQTTEGYQLHDLDWSIVLNNLAEMLARVPSAN